jgi:hypothetical protein
VEAEDPLSELADIHVPDAVSFWPPAPGWWVLAAIVLGLLAYAAFLQFRRWQQGQRLKAALHELQRLQQQWQLTPDAERANKLAQVLHTCNSVLKRVALVHYPAAQVASLNGQAWLNFLDHSGNTQQFSSGAAQLLADGAYRRNANADANTVNNLLQLCQQWIATQYKRKADTYAAVNRTREPT